jgi:HEAT repeat protein
MAAGDPVAAPIDPEPPSPAPIVLERPARPRARRLRGLGVAVAAVLVLGSIASWTWLTLFLHDAGEKSRVRAEIFSLGLGHLQRAVLALFVEDREAAGTEVVETRRLGISDPLLERIEAELRKRPADPVLDDLGHPRAPVRRQALVTLREEVESGARPAGDLIAAAAALGDDDLPVREAAILALSRGGSSAPLLKAFPLGTGLPPLALDAPTFLALVDALSVIADGPAQAALLAWSFQDFERLDAGSEEAEQSLAPNLRILPAHGEPARFARAWILSRGRIGSADVLAFARRAVEGEARLLPLVDAIAGGLANLRGGEAARALAALAAEFHVDHGPRIVEALSALGAAEDLLDLSRAPLPDGLRARAVRAAGRAALASGKGLREIEDGLRELAQADPSAEVRRQAFRTAVELGPGQGAAAAAQALPDPALRDEALEFLAQRPLPASLPILLEHLRRGDADLRQKAARALGATRDPAALGPLALLLYEEPAEVRAGALEALREIGLVRALPLVAGILPPRDPALVEMALEATRCPLERGESPALRLLALREPLGLTGPSDPPQALREARRALLRSALPGAGAGSTAGWPARAEAVLTGVPGR